MNLKCVISSKGKIKILLWIFTILKMNYFEIMKCHSKHSWRPCNSPTECPVPSGLQLILEGWFPDGASRQLYPLPWLTWSVGKRRQEQFLWRFAVRSLPLSWHLVPDGLLLTVAVTNTYSWRFCCFSWCFWAVRNVQVWGSA